MATKSIPIVSNFLYLFANSIFVPTPSVQETITGSFIFSLLMSNSEPKPPIISFFNPLLFWTSFLDMLDICLTSLFAKDMFTPLFCNYFQFFSFINDL